MTGRGTCITLATELEAQLRRLSELPKPVVAGVHGAVAGAGLALVLNADLVVAGESTKFVMAYAAIGLTPDCGVSYLLPRAIGQQRALELAVSGRVLNAVGSPRLGAGHRGRRRRPGSGPNRGGRPGSCQRTCPSVRGDQAAYPFFVGGFPCRPCQGRGGHDRQDGHQRRRRETDPAVPRSVTCGLGLTELN